MKKGIRFKCEICGDESESELEATRCESQGSEPQLVNKGQKVIFRDDWNGGFGTSYDELVVVDIENRGHYISYSLGDEDGRVYTYIDGNKEFENKCEIIQ